MKILITGINGLAGSFIAKKMLADGHEVFGLIRPESNLNLLVEYSNNITWLEGNILDIPNLYKAIEGKDWVINCAGLVSFAPKDQENLYKVNIEGTANVVNACLELGVKKYAQISSVGAIGKETPKKNQKLKVITENNEWIEANSPSNYDKSKYLGELEVWRGMAEGLNAVIVNPSVILGEGDWNKSSTKLFKYIFDKNKFYTDGILNYVDGVDLANSIALLMNSNISSERFIISTGTITYKAFFEKVAKAFKTNPPNIKIGPFASQILWRVEAIKSLLLGTDPLITKETANSAAKIFHYSNDKILNIIPIKFNTIDQTISRVCEQLIKNTKKA
jgi:dihydroflavonol-4-reductase